MPINAAAGHDPYAGPTMMQGGDPGQTAWNPPPGAEPARPDWNQPMPEPPAYTPPAATPPGEQPTLLYGQQPGYTPPGYTPQPQPPAYGQPQTPSYGQPPQPQPTYGQPQTPAYGAQGYGAAPAQPWAGQAQVQPQKKSRTGCIVGCVVALVLVLALVGGGVALLATRGGLTIGGATVGGNTNTGPGGGSIIYQDALNGSTKAQWANDSNCFFGSGGYHINAAFICYAPADKVGDAVTTVSVSQTSGPITYPYGLVIRRVSKGNYYEFLIDANGKWLFDKVVNGTTTDIVKFTADKSIKTGLNQSNTISVQAKGSHFVFSVNGTQVGTADDSTFTSGETGLSGTDTIEVVYTNLIISNMK
jgi:hypothetical protein